jgi:hypothetical protein
MSGARVVVARAVARRRASRDADGDTFSVGETTKSRPARVTDTDRRRESVSLV